MIREYPNDADLGAAVRALEIKNCTTCKNVLISTHSEPCRKCLLYNKWEPKTQLP
jgi:ribosomal protein L40E